MKLLLPVALIGATIGSSSVAVGAGTKVRLETSKGAIVIEVDPASAPLTTANFLAYVRAGFYDGTVFHRVIPGFMVQGGGFTADLERKQTRPPVKNEATNRVPNRRGTVSMARTAEVDSATSQFFVNLTDNAFLDHRDDSQRGFGYCVFGRVIEGMDVVDAIAAVPTGPSGPFPKDVPRETVAIVKASVVE